MPEFSDKMKRCCEKVQAKGHSKESAIRICRVSLGESEVYMQPGHMRLLEIVQSSHLQIDTENGVIRNVRILGPVSANGRRYLPEAVEKGKGLYEGRAVNLNHPGRDDPGADRAVSDRFGWLENIKVVDKGLSGDLHYFKTHPQAAVIVEAAERNPRLFGLSHNAEGKTRRENGTTIVEEITDVRSVDIVSDPATTKSLFESLSQEDEAMPKTLIEVAKTHAAKNKDAKRLLALLEQEDMAAVAAEPTDAGVMPEADPNEEVKAAMEKAAVGVIKKLFAGEIDAAEALKKIKDLLATKEKVAGDSESTPAPEPAPTGESYSLKTIMDKLDRLTEAMAEKPKGGLREDRNTSNGDTYKPPADLKEFKSRFS